MERCIKVDSPFETNLYNSYHANFDKVVLNHVIPAIEKYVEISNVHCSQMWSEVFIGDKSLQDINFVYSMHISNVPLSVSRRCQIIQAIIRDLGSFDKRVQDDIFLVDFDISQDGETYVILDTIVNESCKI